ncbi:MAG: adenylate/guanylate cyclase domain-containing protein [Candidatus Rokubacteria bacterium]|nr:adenylate/guanylate cyclase domain-containing protein [Candidatus Rokubacteria bacterium]
MATQPFGPTVTILFSDIRGFTDYTSQHGDAAAFEVLRQHDEIVRSLLATFGGQVVKTQGDSFMVSFAASRGAILCAVAIQRALAQAVRRDGGTRIGVGIGITTGEPIQQDGDFFGTSVNLAARICAAAGPGQILIAESTRHVAGRIDDAPYLDRGFHELKGFPESQRLFEVVWEEGAVAGAIARGAPLAAAASTPIPVDPRAERVRWWTEMHAAWTAWKSSGTAYAYALRAALAKHPHLLAVPIKESAEHDEGRLAAGYFALLEHVEDRSPGFVAGAVDLALRRAGGANDPEAVGAQLYELFVAQGRLTQTYADFVRDTMTIVSRSGVWLDAAVTEGDDATIVMRHPSDGIGDAAEEIRQLTDAHERGAEQRFTVTALPLTTRFVHLKAGVLRTPRDLALGLTRDGAPCDHACYLTLRTEQVLQPSTKRIPPDGAVLRGIGRDIGEVWLGIFNADPARPTTYEVVLTLTPTVIAADRTTAARPSPFRAPRR